MAKNEVATTEKNFNLVTLTGELKEAVAEELDGLGTLPFERAKIPSGGGLAFELPGETEDEPVMSTDLTGVLIHHHPVNAYWKEEYAGGNVQAMTESREWSVRLGKSMIAASVRITSSEAERTDLEKPARTFTDVTSCRKATLYRLSSLYRQPL